jgi:hypothetical protein
MSDINKFFDSKDQPSKEYLNENTLDPLANYRQMAAERHKKYMEKQKRERDELDRIAAEKLAEELKEQEIKEQEERLQQIKIKDDMDTIDFFMDDLDISIINIHESEDIFMALRLIESKLETIINIVKEYDRLKDVQNKIISLVEVLNKLFEDKKKNSKYVSEINNIVKEIFKLSEIDVNIELMDTTEDEKFAKELQEKLYKSRLED